MNERLKGAGMENCIRDKYATCPYCGHKDKDSWELPGKDEEVTETECGECGKSYNVRREIMVEYISTPILNF
jgi:transcription elongation factor Elf1